MTAVSLGPGAVLARGPGDIKILGYGDGGKLWAAVYVRGDLVRFDDATGWHVLEPVKRHRLPLSVDDIERVRAVAANLEQPIWPPHVALVEVERSSWTPVNLAPVVAGLLDGTLVRPEPTVGRRADSRGLFYAGRVNSIFGPSGDAKTWAMQTVAAQELADGAAVAWVDYEDDEIGAVGRLLDLGVDPQTIVAQFTYFSPAEPFTPTAEDEMRSLLADTCPTLLVIDSTGEAMATENVSSNEDDAVARWTRRVARFLARLGPAVVLVDHVPKARDREKLFAAGSQRKRAAVSGMALATEMAVEFGIGRSGRSRLIVAKDRGGHYTRGSRAAEFVLDATSTPYRYAFEVPSTSTTDESGQFRPTGLMESVSRYIELHPGETTNAITGAVRGKREYVLLAIQALTTEGYISTTKGAKNAVHHYSSSPYREAEEADT